MCDSVSGIINIKKLLRYVIYEKNASKLKINNALAYVLKHFAHHIGQRVVLNHAIVYDKTVRGSVRWYVHPTFEFNSHVYGCILDGFVLSRAVNDHEWTVK